LNYIKAIEKCINDKNKLCNNNGDVMTNVNGMVCIKPYDKIATLNNEWNEV